MKPFRRIITFLVSLPTDLLIGWPAVLIIRFLWGEVLRWEEEALVCQMKVGSWPVNPDKWLGGWYLRRKAPTARAWGGTTLSPHAIFYGPNRDLGGSHEHWIPVQRHEHRHVEQGEAMQLMSFIIGASVVLRDLLLGSGPAIHRLIFGLLIWTFGGYILMGISGWTTAWLRGEAAYRGSFHEEAAYALQDLPPDEPGDDQ